MTINSKEDRGFRLLEIYERFNRGEFLNKVELSNHYKISKKTIQRDIDDIRAYFAERYQLEKDTAIKYNRQKQGYYLIRHECE